MAAGFDLIQAVIAQLEGNAPLQSLFGDTWNQAAQTGVSKFFADLVDQVALPYCLLEETSEQYQYMTRSGPSLNQMEVNFASNGQMRCLVFAESRASTRFLGFAIAQALNDAPLQWPGENDTMQFRMLRSRFIPMPDPSGPGVSVLFCREFFFEYDYSASLQIFS